MENLIKAKLAVMEDIRYIKTDKTVGKGFNAFRTVSGEKLKETFQPAFVKHGLSISQTAVQFEVKFKEYEEEGKQKMRTTIIATCTFKLTHVSGEYEYLQAFGMGIDSTDKAPGIAQSYALRNVLLATFMPATGEDNDDITIDEAPAVQKPKLEPGTDFWTRGINAVKTGKKTVAQIFETVSIEPIHAAQFQMEVTAATGTTSKNTTSENA